MVPTLFFNWCNSNWAPRLSSLCNNWQTLILEKQLTKVVAVKFGLTFISNELGQQQNDTIPPFIQ